MSVRWFLLNTACILSALLQPFVFREVTLISTEAIRTYITGIIMDMLVMAYS